MYRISVAYIYTSANMTPSYIHTSSSNKNIKIGLWIKKTSQKSINFVQNGTVNWFYGTVIVLNSVLSQNADIPKKNISIIFYFFSKESGPRINEHLVIL